MKQRLFAYLFACLLVGLLFATFNALSADGDSSPVRVHIYPRSEADNVIAKINDLQLKNVTAVKFDLKKDFSWFCFETIVATLLTLVGTTLVLVTYTSICRFIGISLKKGGP